MKESELINEVRFIFEEETSMGFTDTLTIKKALREGLDNISGVTSVIKEDIIKIVNGRGKTPDTFKKIYKAAEITPIGYECLQEECHCQEGSEFFNLGNICSNCNEFSNAHLPPKAHKIKESYSWGDVNIHYNLGSELKIEDKLHLRNPNLDNIRTFSAMDGKVKADKYSIYTGIKEGYIYINYLSYPTEDGEIYIPKTPRNDLKNYILNKALSDVAKVIMIKERDSFMSNIYQMYKEEEQLYFERADYESKMMFIKNKDFKKQNRAINKIKNRL